MKMPKMPPMPGEGKHSELTTVFLFPSLRRLLKARNMDRKTTSPLSLPPSLSVVIVFLKGSITYEDCDLRTQTPARQRSICQSAARETEAAPPPPPLSTAHYKELYGRRYLGIVKKWGGARRRRRRRRTCSGKMSRKGATQGRRTDGQLLLPSANNTFLPEMHNSRGCVGRGVNYSAKDTK